MRGDRREIERERERGEAREKEKDGASEVGKKEKGDGERQSNVRQTESMQYCYTKEKNISSVPQHLPPVSNGIYRTTGLFFPPFT